MARQTLTSRNSRIEILEPLVLMSASAADVDLPADFDELPGQDASVAGSTFGISVVEPGSTQVLVAIPVEAGIGAGAGPIPVEGESVETAEIFVGEAEFPTDPDDLTGPSGGDLGSGPAPTRESFVSERGGRSSVDSVMEDAVLPPKPPVEGVDFGIAMTSEIESLSQVDGGQVVSEDGNTLLLDHAMSITALTSAGAAGPEAQSGFVQDSQMASAGMVADSDLSPGFAIEQPPTYTPTIEGTDAGEWIAGTPGDDVIAAGGGDDEIYTPAGDNFVDGGDGVDTLVVYEGSSSEYTLVHRSDNVSFLEGPGLNGETVKVALYNVERIQFNDKTVPVWLTSIPVGNPSDGAATIVGTDEGEWVGGTSANDKISAGGGDDEIYAALGENEIDGGDGEDTLLVYQGNRADYSLLNIGDGTIFLEGPGLNGETVRNTLRNVERILFNDEVVMTAGINDLGDHVQSMNGPGGSIETIVADSSNIAAISEGTSAEQSFDSNADASDASNSETSGSSSLSDLSNQNSTASGEILMSASQAFEMVTESGFEEEPITSESLTSFVTEAVEVLENAGVNVQPVAEVDFDALADEALTIVEDAGVDFSEVTTSEVVEAASESLEVLQQSGAVTQQTLSEAVDVAVDSLTEDGLVIGEANTLQVVASGRELLESDELAGLEEFLQGMGIDIGSLLSNGQ